LNTSNDPLASASQHVLGSRSAVYGWGFAPGGLDHWRSAFSFAFGNAGSSTECQPRVLKFTAKQ